MHYKETVVELTTCPNQDVKKYKNLTYLCHFGHYQFRYILSTFCHLGQLPINFL